MRKKIMCIILLVPCLAFAKNVAVVDFKNNTGKDALQFLSFSLAETISNIIAKDRELQVIERTQIKKIFKELNFQIISKLKILKNTGSYSSLQDLGPIDPRSLKKIELLNADYLILGSFQGTKDITVFIRAVNVSTGKIMTSAMLEGSLENIFPKIEEAAVRIIAHLKGKKLFCLSINTHPAGADVYLDEQKIGVTPLACHKLTSGSHDLSIIKTGYKKHNETVIIADKRKDIDVTMLNMEMGYRTGIAVGYFYFNSADFSQQQDQMFSFRINQSFNILRASLEYAQTMGNLDYSYDYAVPYNTQSEKRRVRIYQANLLLAVFPFSTFAYVSPYLGVQTGYCHMLETGINSEYFGNRKKGYDLYTFGGFAGILFLPYSRINFFTEFRYMKSFINDTRDIVDSIYFGNVNKEEKRLKLSAYQVGGGINLYF